MGRCADENAVDGRSGLDSRGRVHHVPRDHGLPRLGPRVEGDERLAGCDPNADVELERVVPLVERCDRVADRERGAHSALRVVLVRGRRAVDGDDGVADELLDRPAVSLELSAERLVVPAQHRADVLRVELLGARRRADQVDEDGRDDLPLLACRRLRAERRAACVAKPRVVRVLAAALGAGDHAASVRRLTTLTDSARP